MHAIEDQYTKFILDALRDPQPVQVGEQRRDVVVKLCPDCETCGGINVNQQRRVTVQRCRLPFHI